MNREIAYSMTLEKNNPTEAEIQRVLKSIENEINSGECPNFYSCHHYKMSEEVADRMIKLGFRIFITQSSHTWMTFIYWGEDENAMDRIRMSESDYGRTTEYTTKSDV